jgi:carbonic anhydrase
MAMYDKALERNRAWAEERKRTDPGYFEQMESGQQPELLYIGCSDSRVPANTLMGLSPGDVFVHRNIANLVPNTDTNVHSVLEFALEQLEVKHVIVCGHTQCGGIRAAMRPSDMGSLNGWLRNITDVYRLHFDELSAIKDEEARHRRLVELNAEEQCVNVIKSAAYQRRRRARRAPQIHAWIYEVGTGRIVDLKPDLDGLFSKYQSILRFHE